MDNGASLGRGPRTAGAEASDRWRAMLGLPVVPKWFAEIALSATPETTFELNIYAEEWGFAFRHGRRASWIRVTDIPFVHGRDDFGLLRRIPNLIAIGTMLAELERTYGVELRHDAPRVRTNLPNANTIMHDWILQPAVAR